MGEPAEHADNPAIPIFAETKAAIERWRREGADVGAVKARLAAMPFLSGNAGDALHDDALAARAYSLLRLDPEVIDRIIDGSLLAGTDTASPVTVPVFVLASDPALSAFTSGARGAAARPRTRTSRSCDSTAPATASMTSARTGTSTRGAWPRSYRAAAARSSPPPRPRRRGTARVREPRPLQRPGPRRGRRRAPANVCVAIRAASSATGSDGEAGGHRAAPRHERP